MPLSIICEYPRQSTWGDRCPFLCRPSSLYFANCIASRLVGAPSDTQGIHVNEKGDMGIWLPSGLTDRTHSWENPEDLKNRSCSGVLRCEEPIKVSKQLDWCTVWNCGGQNTTRLRKTAAHILHTVYSTGGSPTLRFLSKVVQNSDAKEEFVDLVRKLETRPLYWVHGTNQKEAMVANVIVEHGSATFTI